MPRYFTKGNIEDECELGGKVLKNKLGIRSKKEMDKVEYERLAATQAHYHGIIEPHTRFTNRLICKMHYHWLGSLYEWAGKYRTVNLAKMDFVWPPARFVSANMDLFEETFLKKLTPCYQGSIETVSLNISKVHAEFLLVHPFREGNGRLARLISDLMALQAGYPAPDFAFDQKKNRERYLVPVTKGYVQDYELLTHVVKEAMDRSKRLMETQ